MSALCPPPCLRLSISRLGSRINPRFVLQPRQFSCTPLNLKKKAVKKKPKFNFDRFKTPPRRVYPELPDLLPELKARGLVSQHTDLQDAKQPVKWSSLRAFCAVDPSSMSLHLGHLMTFMPLIHMSLRGHKTYILIRNFTAQMQDRFGETSPELWNEDELGFRTKDIEETATRIFAHAGEIARKHGLCGELGQLHVLENKSWWGKSEDVWDEGFDLADFLGNARWINLGRILAKQPIKELLDDGKLNLGRLFLESMHTLDFKHLWDEHKIRFQVGSSDQWDLIAEGIDCIKKLTGSLSPHGITVPSLLGPTGEKYNQRTKNAILIGELDHEGNPPLDLYQQLLHTLDDHVAQYLKFFTLLPLPQIDDILTAHAKDPSKRLAQRHLAEELVSLILGVETAERCVFQMAALYPAKREERRWNVGHLVRAFKEDDRLYKQIPAHEVLRKSIARLLDEHAFVDNYEEGYRMIQKGKLQVNGVQIKEDVKLDLDSLIEGRLLMVQMGKSKVRIIDVVPEKEMELARQAKEEAGSKRRQEFEGDMDDSEDIEDEVHAW